MELGNIADLVRGRTVIDSIERRLFPLVTSQSNWGQIVQAFFKFM